MKDKKSLIIYFSRADENYFGGEMRYVDKGNTEVIAEYIKEITGADMFKVEPLNPYPANYMECIEEAKVRTREHNAPIKKMFQIFHLTKLFMLALQYIGVECQKNYLLH